MCGRKGQEFKGLLIALDSYYRRDWLALRPLGKLNKRIHYISTFEFHVDLFQICMLIF